MLEESAGTRDFLARVSGDEFAIVTSEDRAGVVLLIERIMKKAKEVFSLDGVEVALQPTAGVVFAGPEHKEPADCIRDVNLAVQAAKQDGEYGVSYFDERTGTKLRRNLGLRNNLFQAFDNDELELYYQPIHSARGEEKVYFEALLRWNHTRYGQLQPQEFLTHFDTPRRKNRLDDWVLKRAAEQAKELSKLPKFAGVSLNLNPARFAQANFAGEVESLLNGLDLAPHYLRLEMTEDAVLLKQKTAIVVMQKLRRLGVKIYLDDFGTGYSSLHYLSSLPLDAIKIDRTFVQTMETNQSNYQLVAMIVNIARTLELEVVAEGVESAAQLAILREFDYAAVQGYYYARPMPFAKVDEYLA